MSLRALPPLPKSPRCACGAPRLKSVPICVPCIAKLQLRAAELEAEIPDRRQEVIDLRADLEALKKDLEETRSERDAAEEKLGDVERDAEIRVDEVQHELSQLRETALRDRDALLRAAGLTDFEWSCRGGLTAADLGG